MSEDQVKADDIIDIEPNMINETLTPESARSDSATSTRRVWRNGVLGLLLGLLFAIAGGWIYRQTLSNYFPSDQVAALSARLDGIETANKETAKRVDAAIALTEELKSKLSAAQATADKSQKVTADLQNKTTGVATDVETLKQDMATAQVTLDNFKSKLSSGVSGAGAPDVATGARIAALEKALAALNAAPAVAKNESSAMAQAITSIKAKIADGVAFQQEFDTLKKLAPQVAGLDVLGSVAQAGSANAAQLAMEIDGIIAKLPKAEAKPAAAQSWLDHVGSYFSGLVSIKTIDAGDISIVAQKASALVASGDFVQALDVLDKSGITLSPDLQRWHEKVASRMAVEQALNKTSAEISLLVAAKG